MRLVKDNDGNSFVRFSDPDTLHVRSSGEGSDFTYENNAYRFSIREKRGIQANDWKSGAKVKLTT